MIYRVRHRTAYDYNDVVSLSHHITRLRPRELKTQRVISHECRVSPTPTLREVNMDVFGNEAAFISVESPHRHLEVEALSVVETLPAPPPEPVGSQPWELIREAVRGDGLRPHHEACAFGFDSPFIELGPDLLDYARSSFPPDRPVVEAVLDLTRRIHEDFVFDSKATTISTPLREVLALRRGVCQDFAHLQIGCLRSTGIPARYISGYLETRPPPGQQKLAGADASHAWLAAYCGGAGWVELDPTNNVVPSGRHVVVGWGRDYSDVSPIRGVLLGSGNHVLKVSVDVIPLQAPDDVP